MEEWGGKVEEERKGLQCYKKIKKKMKVQQTFLQILEALRKRPRVELGESIPFHNPL